MNYPEELQKDVVEKTELFIFELKGRYEKYVSDEILQVYLQKSFYEEYNHAPHRQLSNIAYNVGVQIFESLLEHGCGAMGNGHHVAQKYAMFFPNENAKTVYKQAFRDDKIDKIID